jgi:hypothetical protein
VGYLSRFLSPPHRRVTIRAGLSVLVIAFICWFARVDVWHAVLLGVGITVIGLIASAVDMFNSESTRWQGSTDTNRQGARNDIVHLSASLRGGAGRVKRPVVVRVQRLAAQRLADRGLDLSRAEDRPQIEALIGRGPYRVLAQNRRRPPLLRSVMACLDAIDALDPTHRVVAAPQPTFWSSLVNPSRPRRTHA